MTKPYIIDIVGDNILSTGIIHLTDEEIAGIRKVFNAMTADGPYAPIIYVSDIEAERERQLKMKEEQKRQEELERKQREEEERLRFPTSMAMAFEKAMAMKTKKS